MVLSLIPLLKLRAKCHKRSHSTVADRKNFYKGYWVWSSDVLHTTNNKPALTSTGAGAIIERTDMKYIEKKYQQLIQDIESAYDDTCDTLKYHINELKKMLAERDEEIEKLKGGSKLQAEVDEYNRLEAQKNMRRHDER